MQGLKARNTSSMYTWLNHQNSLKQIIGHVLKICLTVVLLSKCSYSETCSPLNACSCQFSNGSIIDLTSLASVNGPRWKDVKAEDKKSFVYSYNPCYSFAMGNGDCSYGVAVCQSDGGQYQDCGDQDKVEFLWDASQSSVVIRYRSTLGRSTNVTLKCPSDLSIEDFVVLGEVSTMSYGMILTTKCACPGLCGSRGLSTGSSLVIILFVFIIFYLLLGMVYNHLVRGAHGLELIPNYEFWKDFPLLVRDGCVFISSGCRSETAYERI